jgi:predicted deacylase
MQGKELEIPVTVVCGAEPGPVLWLNGATHGDEAEGPLSILLTLEQLSPRELKGAVVAVPVVNVNAFAAGTRGDSLDPLAYDLNRIYPGRPDGRATERLAYAHYEAMMSSCDLEIAVHSGGDHSYLCEIIFAPETPACLELAAAMGPDWPLVWKAFLRSDLMAPLAKEGKGAINIELGGQCRTLTREFREVTKIISRSFMNVMRHYGMIPGEAHYLESWKRGSQVALFANATGIWVADPDVEFGQEIPQGTELGRIMSLYGDVLDTLKAPADGLVFGLRARPSVRTGDWLLFFGIVDEVRDDLLPKR